MWMVVGRLIEESEHSGQLRRDQTGTAHPVWPAGRPGEARRRRAPRGAITRGRRRSLRGPLQASQLGCVRPRAQDASKPADAEDLPQEIFLQAYDKIDKFEGRSAFGTWLYRLGVNRCLDHLRSRSAKERSRTEPLGPTLPGRAGIGTRNLELERAIGELPPSSRAAFLLHDVEGYEHKEVGEILGIAVGTSKSLVHRARMKLRTRLNPIAGETS